MAKCKIPDVHVTCLFAEDCLLPCSFPTGHDPVTVQWYQQDKLILSLAMQNKSQPANSGRMYVDQQQLIQGNASLHLSLCGIKDRGRYLCKVNSSMGDQESYVIMKVEAPLKTVTMEIDTSKEILCLSKDIFPAPRLQWSTLPPSAILKSKTSMTANSEGLYSIQSKLKMLANNPTYICMVNSTYGTQSWRTSLQEKVLNVQERGRLAIPCMAPQNIWSAPFSLKWTFTKSHEPTTILTYDSRTRKTTILWTGQVKLDQNQVLKGNGSLLFLHPKSSQHTGTYTCAFSGIQSGYTVRTIVAVSSSHSPRTGESKSSIWMIALVVAGLILLAVGLLLYRRWRGGHGQVGKTTADDTELQPIKNVKTVDESTMDNQS